MGLKLFIEIRKRGNYDINLTIATHYLRNRSSRTRSGTPAWQQELLAIIGLHRAHICRRVTPLNIHGKPLENL